MESDSDSDDVILMAKFANVRLPGKQNLSDKRRGRGEQEEERKLAQLEQKKQESKNERLSKQEQRRNFSMEALKASESRNTVEKVVPEPSKVQQAQETHPVDLKERLKAGLEEQDARKAIDLLESVLEEAETSNIKTIELGAATMLGKRYMELGETRAAIQNYQRALDIANLLQLPPEQHTNLVVTLQSLYQEVGEPQQALRLQGAPRDQIAITADLAASIQAAIDEAVMANNMDGAKDLVAAFKHTHFAKSVVNYQHSPTGATLLHVAAGRNDGDFVRQLVETGADVHVRDQRGLTPLLWAARFGGTSVLDELFHLGARFDDTLTAAEIASWPETVRVKVNHLVQH